MLEDKDLNMFLPIAKVTTESDKQQSDDEEEMAYQSNSQLLQNDLSNILFNVDESQEVEVMR